MQRPIWRFNMLVKQCYPIFKVLVDANLKVFESEVGLKKNYSIIKYELENRQKFRVEDFNFKMKILLWVDLT